MAKKKVNFKDLTERLLDFFSSHITVDSLILFGSYAYGRPHEFSDIDIAVISEDLEKMSFFKKIKLFAKAASVIDIRIELLGFSKKDYLHPEDASFLSLIKKKGKILFKGAKK